MVTIALNNSYSQIKGLTTGPFSLLRKELSYKNRTFNNNWTKTVYLIDNKGFYPSGLTNRVKKYLTNQKIQFNVVDNRVKPKGNYNNLAIFKVKKEFSLIPNECQLNALNACIANAKGTLSIPTGVGKSFVIGLIAHHYQVKTLVVVPNLELKAQLTQTLANLFENTSHITVENIDSPNLKKLDEAYDCLIIDEAHHVASKTYKKLNKVVWKSIYYRFFLTATPYRTKTEENIVFEGIAGEIIYKLSYREAIRKGYIVPVEAYYYDLPKIENDYYTYQEVYKNLVVNNVIRTHITSQILQSLYECKISTLCLVREIDHGSFIRSQTGIWFANGQDEDSKKHINDFKSGKIKSLIATTGVCGEGCDTVPAEYIIIAGLGKAKGAFLQQIGRAVRRYPGKESAKIILFRDRSHKFLLRHFREQVKILKDEFGIEAIKL